MSKLIYYVAASIDGFIATQDHSLDWLDAFTLGEDATPYDKFYQNIGAIILGSTTYSWIMQHAPNDWPYKNIPAFVVSSKNLDVPAELNITVIDKTPSVITSTAKNAANGKDVWLVGGGQCAAYFADAGELKQIFLTTIPVFLGSGVKVLPTKKNVHTTVISIRCLQSGATESLLDVKN